MAKDQGMVMQGEVMVNLGPGGYTVRIHELGLDVNAVAAGKMRNHRIGILPGDTVDVELSPYEPTKGRIVYRHSKDKPRPQPYQKNAPRNAPAAPAATPTTPVKSS